MRSEGEETEKLNQIGNALVGIMVSTPTLKKAIATRKNEKENCQNTDEILGAIIKEKFYPDKTFELFTENWDCPTSTDPLAWGINACNAIVERDGAGGKIIKAGIVSTTHRLLPPIIADKSGCYIYYRRPIPIKSRETCPAFVKNIQRPVNLCISTQGNDPRRVWLKNILKAVQSHYINAIRPNYSAGIHQLLEYFVNVWESYHDEAMINPLNSVIMEPFPQPPFDEIKLFVVNALNKSLPANQRFFISDMSGIKLFDGQKIDSGWIAGSSKDSVMESLRAIYNVMRKPEYLVLAPYEDLDRFIEAISKVE